MGVEKDDGRHWEREWAMAVVVSADGGWVARESAMSEARAAGSRGNAGGRAVPTASLESMVWPSG